MPHACVVTMPGMPHRTTTVFSWMGSRLLAGLLDRWFDRSKHSPYLTDSRSVKSNIGDKTCFIRAYRRDGPCGVQVVAIGAARVHLRKAAFDTQEQLRIRHRPPRLHTKMLCHCPNVTCIVCNSCTGWHCPSAQHPHCATCTELLRILALQSAPDYHKANQIPP